MARKARAVSAPVREETALTVTVDPLTVPRGHRALPRGGVHGTARRPKRARAKQQWRRQLSEGRGGCRGRRR